jgi:Lrp/AsnC family leucine-responsive transcriptional regulator
MENQGIIDGYEVRLNPERFSKNQVAFINVFVESNFDDNGAIGDKLSDIDEVQEVHFIAGEDSYLVKLRVADSKELNIILRQKIAVIKGILKTHTSTVLATYKDTARISIK